MRKLKRVCETCHHEWGRETEDFCNRCFDGGFDGYPQWQPMTNGDRVRHMGDEQLRDLWARTEFETPVCDFDKCDYPDFVCSACPKAFYEWLKEVAKDE